MAHDRSPKPPDGVVPFDPTSTGVIVRDLEGNLIGWNLAAERMLRGCFDPLQGPPERWFSWVRILDEHGDELDPATTPGTVAARTGVVITDQVLGLIERATGALIWVRAGATPFRDDEGRIQGAVVTFEELTGREASEARGRVAQDLLELLGDAPAGADPGEAPRRCARASNG